VSRIQSSVGLVTGIEIDQIVTQLMGIAARPRDMLATRLKVLQAQQAAVNDLMALTLGVQLAIRRFKTTTLFDEKSVDVRGYAFEGTIALDRLLSGVVELPTRMASPTGVVPEWQRQIPGEVPAASGGGKAA